MDVLELKFLLRLLGFPDYRAPIAKIKPNPETKVAERDSICRSLRDRAFVAYNVEVTQFAIAPPGKSLLGLDTARLPITDSELKVLLLCASETITPEETGIPIATRGAIIQGLADRGLIEAEKTQIKEVWLTERGQNYLLWEYNPSGTAPALSLDMLSNYLRFMRKSLRHQMHETSLVEENLIGDIPPNRGIAPTKEGSVAVAKEAQPIAATQRAIAPTDADILQAIRDLDREFGTENYLPIYHLRQKFQPPLTRDELDRALYRLQRNDQIELSSLQEAIAYTSEQIDAGISQDVGGPLFFLIVT